jgi:hypothetical protein
LPLVTAREYVRQITGDDASAGPDIAALELGLDGQDSIFTPNYAALMALDSLAACEASGADQDCLSRTFKQVIGSSTGAASKSMGGAR